MTASDDSRDLATFLYYGWVPRPAFELEDEVWYRPPGERLPADSDPEPLLAEGIELFRKACADPGPGLHVLPLSGGGDSRLILAMLLEAGLGDRLLTVTFGTPGTLDYELGREVARHAGVRHELIDLTRVEYTEAALESCLEPRPPWTLVWDAIFNDQIPLRYGTDATYWTGYMANTLAGGRYAPEEGRTWPEARRLLAARERLVRTHDLCAPGFDPAGVLPDTPLVEDGRLTYYEQLFLGILNAPRHETVLFTPGYRYRCPFSDPDWIDFGLRIPGEWRRGQGFYRRLMRRAAPELFALPSKIHLGLPLGAPRWRRTLARARSRAARLARQRFPRLGRAAAAKTNFVDFDVELRRDGSLTEVTRASLEALRERGAVDWVDVDRLWREHRAWRRNHGRALVHLAAAELSLRALERSRATPATS